jgi:Asp-tRNA(Asn)/Glu-tRNA(Gln) amidotransferase A subunit family amidase
MAHSFTIHQLVEQLRAGELSSREATQACLDRVVPLMVKPIMTVMGYQILQK